MDRIAVGVQETDGDGLDAGLLEARDGVARDRLVQHREHAAVGGDALFDLESHVTGYERRRLVDEQVVHVVAAFAPDLDGVAEPRGGQKSRPGALALDERVGGQRRPVYEGADIGGARPGIVEHGHYALLDGLRRVLGSREELADLDSACRVVHPDEVGEGATDVDADASVLRRGGGHGARVYTARRTRQGSALRVSRGRRRRQPR